MALLCFRRVLAERLVPAVAAAARANGARGGWLCKRAS